MKRTIFFAVTTVLLVSSAALRAADAPKPNLVIINIDDMGYADTGPFGSTLNRLYRSYVQPKVLPFRTHLPLYSLQAAAGRWGQGRTWPLPRTRYL